MRKNIVPLIIIAVAILTLSAVTYVIAGADPEDKLVALTYDDGPHPKYTSEILDVLKKHNAQATFFMLGERAKELPDVVLRMYHEGHSIGNHTYDHTELTRLNDKGIILQINRTNDIIEGITGMRPILMRPPLGLRNKRIDDLINGQNMYNILWNVDPVDWDSKGAELIHNAVAKKVQNGDIVILHDFYPNTVTATDMILTTLGARGYRFVTVDDLLRFDEKAAREDVYYSGRPENKTWR